MLVLPERIARLEEIASNLWWTCRPHIRELFHALDYPLWRSSQHNPVKQLRNISPERLQAAANDPLFLRLYDSTVAYLDADLAVCKGWFGGKYPECSSQATIAYFSAEFAIHNSLPIYAGGLGVLAGDICKETCNLGLPLVAVGFMYPQGYFQQRITADGWQEEIYKQLNFDEAPVTPIVRDGRRSLVQIQLGSRILHIGAWQVSLGQATLYLLDTNVEENSLQDRQLSNRLYTADMEQRLQQEIVLGIGGVRLLRTLGINPLFWHANEGHTAFMVLERIREEVARGASTLDAMSRTRALTAFTTHTPVPAGHDIFDIGLIDKYFSNYWGSLGLDREGFIQLGRYGQGGFNMAMLGLKMASYRNAVSKLHGMVARRMWHVLWPDIPEDDVPIVAITNGVHVPTWIAPELSSLLQKYLGEDLLANFDDAGLLAGAREIPDAEIWQVHTRLKRKLIGALLERTRNRWASGEITAPHGLAMGALLDPDALTIAYCRRFTEYKRPALILYDLERLKRILRNQWRPVQIIFAGKSHPADFLSKYLLHRVYVLAADREFQGRIAFVEDYDIHVAHYLAQGADVWLNNPRRLDEACGTSGMKAGLNGVLNFSVRDGWWNEGYNGANGWAIGDTRKMPDPESEDRADAESLYNTLENQIVPLFYDRDRSGIPHGWARMIKESIATVGPTFSATRMLKEYTESMYLPAIRSLKTAEVKPAH